MHPHDLDDLFRQQFDGHASEPGADLWARLQARTAAPDEAQDGAANPLDARFRAGLAGHATPPRRELWERLEDEHLRPRQRRRPVVAWGRLAIAASLLLLLLAGGAGLWLRQPGQPTGPVAATTPHPATSTAANSANAANAATTAASRDHQAAGNRQSATSSTIAATTPAPAGPAISPARREKTTEIFTAQATRSFASPSSSPVARTTRQRRPATALPAGQLPLANPTPDAATGLPTPGNRPDAPVVARVAPAAEPEVILVEVRRGPAPATPAATPAVVAAAPRPTPRRRLRLGGLLRQAGNLVQGDPVSLADAGLPDSLTLQTRLGGRRLGGTLRL